MDFLTELVDHKFEATWFLMPWKVPHEILVLPIDAFSRIKHYILNLIFVMSLFIHIQGYEIGWFFVHEKAHILKFPVFQLLRLIVIWKFAMNIKVNFVIPR